MKELHNPADMPDCGEDRGHRGAVIRATILTPTTISAAILKLCQDRRGIRPTVLYGGNARHADLRFAAQRSRLDFYDG